MSLTVNTNIASLNAQRDLNSTENMLSVSMEQLSSGLRINQAADDVAGYAISQGLEGQINGLSQAYQNSQFAVALVQTGQGAMNDVENLLQRIRTLAVQYENGTNSEENKTAIKEEVSELQAEVKRVGEKTEFDGKNLLNEAATIKFQVGANAKETIEVKTIKLAEGAKVKKALEAGLITGGEGKPITEVNEAIQEVATLAGKFGSVQNRLQYTQSNIEVYTQNESAANAAIKDVNMAEAMANFTKQQVLQQAGVAILAQANALPQAVLKLVGG